MKDGIIQPGRRPRNRFFVWTDPKQKHDLVVFLGEAQPPVGQVPVLPPADPFAKELGVERVFTFAAMATQMHPESASRVFGAATDQAGLEELKRLELEILEDGHIGGLNGVLLGAAADGRGSAGACLLGRDAAHLRPGPVPQGVAGNPGGVHHDRRHRPRPRGTGGAGPGGGGATRRAARARRGAVRPAGVRGPRRTRTDRGVRQPRREPEEEPPSTDAEGRIEELFGLATTDRSKAFELKQELDRLGLFKEYEDRFLDLFKKVE